MVLATNNKDKIKEMKQILQLDIKSLKDVNIDIDVEEDQNTFYGNASKKAKVIYELVKEAVIADDSGLCITALDNFPGVLTHRFLGAKVTDEERNLDLINQLKGIDNRKAKVVCNLVYFDGINEIVGEGILEGTIALRPRGDNGFGFDSIFELDSGKTLAELSSDEKNQVSARYLAIMDLKQKMQKCKKYEFTSKIK